VAFPNKYFAVLSFLLWLVPLFPFLSATDQKYLGNESLNVNCEDYLIVFMILLVVDTLIGEAIVN